MVQLVRSGNRSIRRTLGRPIVCKRARLLPLRICVLTLETLLFRLLRRDVPCDEIRISFLERLLIVLFLNLVFLKVKISCLFLSSTVLRRCCRFGAYLLLHVGGGDLVLLLVLDPVRVRLRRCLLHFLLAYPHLHQLFGLQLQFLPLRIGHLVFHLHLFERLILLMEQLIMLFQLVLVHDLQHILVLLILVLKIAQALLIRVRQHFHFLFVGLLQFLLHFLEGLRIEFALLAHI